MHHTKKLCDRVTRCKVRSVINISKNQFDLCRRGQPSKLYISKKTTNESLERKKTLPNKERPPHVNFIGLEET